MPTINIIESLTLHYQNSSENSDKVYIVQLVEAGGMYGVRFAYGPRSRRTPVTGWKCGGTNRHTASSVYSSIVEEKMGKGYDTFASDYYRPEWKTPPWPTGGYADTVRDDMAAVLKAVKTPKPQPKDEENQEEMGIRARLFEIWSLTEQEQAALKPEVEELEQKIKEFEAKTARR